MSPGSSALSPAGPRRPRAATLRARARRPLVVVISNGKGDDTPRRLSSARDLVRLLRDEAAANPDGFELRATRPGASYPQLIVSVRGTLAFVSHVPDDGHPGFHSLGEPGARAKRTAFPRGSVTRVPASHVVPLDRAIEAAIDFSIDPERPPTSLAWIERL